MVHCLTRRGRQLAWRDSCFAWRSASSCGVLGWGAPAPARHASRCRACCRVTALNSALKVRLSVRTCHRHAIRVSMKSCADKAL